LKIAESEAFDVVFLDVILPDGNGLDHISNLRAFLHNRKSLFLQVAGRLMERNWR